MMQMNKRLHPAKRAKSVLALTLLGTAMSAGAVGTGKQAKPDWPVPVSDTTKYAKLMVDRLEYHAGEDEDAVLWDAQFWYGGDYNRLWIETEGEDIVSGGEGGELENLDVLYSRRVSRFWDFQAGAGYQSEYGPGPDQDRFSAVVGMQGLAPYWFEVDANLRLSEDGDLSADLEGEYDWLLTQRLMLQPRFETSFAFQEVEEFGVGQGLTGITAGIRLRYEIRREFAPYIGVTWSRKLGDTADLAEDEGENIESSAVVAGVRMWF